MFSRFLQYITNTILPSKKSYCPSAKDIRQLLLKSPAFLIKVDYDKKENELQIKLLDEYLETVVKDIYKAVENGDYAVSLRRLPGMNGKTYNQAREYLEKKGYELVHQCGGNYLIRW